MSGPNLVEAYLVLPDQSMFVLGKPSMTVGRVPENDICLRDKSLSRSHAILKCEGGRWQLEDLGSRNLTFVKGKQLEPNKPVDIPDGAALQFGDATCTFRLGRPVVDAPDGKTVALDAAAISGMLEGSSFKTVKGPQDRPDLGEAAKAGRTAAQAPIDRNTYAYLELRSITNPVRFPITKEAVIIGSDPSKCDVVLHDSQTSFEHAEIRFLKGDRVQLKNLSQEHGTFVDGRRVARAWLVDGTTIDIGDASLTFKLLQFPKLIDKGGNKTPVRLLIVVILLIMGGAGAYLYNDSLKKEAEQKKKSEIKQRTAQQPLLTTDNVIDKVKGGQYADALAVISTIQAAKTAGGDAEKLNTWKGEIQAVIDARKLRRDGDRGRAFEAISKVPDGSPIAQAAQREINDIRNSFQEMMGTLNDALKKAQQTGDADGALDAIGKLEQYDKVNAADLARTRDRILLLKDLRRVTTEQKANLASNHEAVISATEALIQQAEEKGKTDPKVAEQLQDVIRLARDMNIHGQFLREYFKFKGDSSRLTELRGKISPSYDKAQLDDISARMKIVEQLTADLGEYKTLLASVKGGSGSEGSMGAVNQLIDLMNQMRVREPDPRFELTKDLLKNIDDLEGTKRQVILEKWTRQVAPSTATGSRGILEGLIANRKKAFEVLSLYSTEAVRNRGDKLLLAQLVRDEELRTILGQAYNMYDQAGENLLVEARSLLTSGKEKDTARDLPKFFEQLKALSLVDDVKSIDQKVAQLGAN